jgi:hypothetical protein
LILGLSPLGWSRIDHNKRGLTARKRFVQPDLGDEKRSSSNAGVG